MSRPGALLLVLVALDASAQVVRPMGETPGDPGPAAATTPEAPVNATPLAPRAGRFSRLSAGRGGPLFAFAEILDGLVVGALIGTGVTAAQSTSPFAAPQGAYLGALIGGVGLGGLAAVLQYFQPIGLLSAGAAALGLGVGALAGLGASVLLAERVPGLPSVLPGVLALVGSQIGALVPLALLWTVDDLSAGDLALLGSGALYGLALTVLASVAVTGGLSAGPALLAPAIGTAIGGLVAALTELPLGAVLRFTGLPLGVGLAVFYVGAVFFGAAQLAAVSALVGIGLTAGITALVSAATEPPRPRDAAPVEVMPTVSFVPPGPGVAPWAAGPALVGRF
ncbi:MAG: hypothetical protein SFW67_34555 [Myxococcaceae bacterium]|nr:hypothetical protein [Myxococcaceae bacterium]